MCVWGYYLPYKETKVGSIPTGSTKILCGCLQEGEGSLDSDSDSGATTFATTELFLERLGLSSLTELPDIAPLLPDVDVIDELTDQLDAEPRFAKLSAASERDKAMAFDVDTEGDGSDG